MANETFSVDTKLFRELGELLVGKNSTALAELIKNSYDADARNVIVSGTNLDDPTRGMIQIVDDGVGMNASQFRSGFLTIAGREKEAGGRHSSVLGRPFTGEKGVGRLAARKLGKYLEIETWPYSGRQAADGELLAEPVGVDAIIDWDAVEACRSLSEVEAAGAVQVQEGKTSAKSPKAGTSITIRRLSAPWANSDVDEFQLELLSLLPLPAVASSVPKTFGERLIFDSLSPENADGRGQFSIHYEGDFSNVDAPKAADPTAANWVVEIDSDVGRGSIIYVVAPSSSVVDRYEATRETVSVPIAANERSVSFRARIYERENQTWDPSVRGIKVYMEGFRILPYGGPQDDWLLIDQDYTDRQKQYLRRLVDFAQWLPEGREQEELAAKRNSSYMGAVILTRKGAPNLEMLVNREGFVPSREVSWLTKRVRLGIDLLQRVRYSTTQELKSARKRYLAEKRAVGEDVEQAPSVLALRDAATKAAESLGDARESLARGDYDAVAKHLVEASAPQAQVAAITQEMGTEQAMFRILASVGAQLSAFSHEINSLVSLSGIVMRQLERLRDSSNVTTAIKTQLAATHQRASDLHHSLERQAIYLTDLSGIESRRRRVKNLFYERLASAVRLLQGARSRAGVEIESRLPRDLQSPPMFPAEVTALFTNLLSNSIKFAGKNGKILVRSLSNDSSTSVIFENTGVAVNLDESEKWFEPFKSTTSNVEAVLGQGMGMGLTIVRSILDEYGASVSFSAPSPGYATAIEMTFPER